METEDQYRMHKGSLVISMLRWINPILVLIPVSSRSILILRSHLSLGLPVCLPDNILKAPLLSSILATTSANLNLLDLITLLFN